MSCGLPQRQMSCNNWRGEKDRKFHGNRRSNESRRSSGNQRSRCKDDFESPYKKTKRDYLNKRREMHEENIRPTDSRAENGRHLDHFSCLPENLMEHILDSKLGDKILSKTVDFIKTVCGDTKEDTTAPKKLIHHLINYFSALCKLLPPYKDQMEKISIYLMEMSAAFVYRDIYNFAKINETTPHASTSNKSSEKEHTSMSNIDYQINMLLASRLKLLYPAISTYPHVSINFVQEERESVNLEQIHLVPEALQENVVTGDSCTERITESMEEPSVPLSTANHDHDNNTFSNETIKQLAIKQEAIIKKELANHNDDNCAGNSWNATESNNGATENLSNFPEKCEDAVNVSSVLESSFSGHSNHVHNEDVNVRIPDQFANTKIVTIKATEQFFATGTTDGKVLFFDNKKGYYVDFIQVHDKPITSLGTWQERVITVSMDGTIKSYDLNTRSLRSVPVDSPICCCDCYDGIVFAGTIGGHILSFNIRSMTQMFSPSQLSHTMIVFIKFLHLSSNTVVVISAMGKPLMIRDMKKGSLIMKFSLDDITSLTIGSGKIFCGRKNNKLTTIDFTKQKQCTQLLTIPPIIFMDMFNDNLVIVSSDGFAYFLNQNLTYPNKLKLPAGQPSAMCIYENKIILSSSTHLHMITIPQEIQDSILEV